MAAPGFLFSKNRIKITRMHVSRMRNVRISSHVYPSMHWALCITACTGQGGVCPGGLPRGFARGGVCLGGLPGGVSGQGVSAQGRACVSQHTLRQTPHPVDRMADRCKKHNLRKLRLRTVIKARKNALLTELAKHGSDSIQGTDYIATQI